MFRQQSMCEQMCTCIKNRLVQKGACLYRCVFVHSCLHRACCAVFLSSSLRFWQICCCSVHLIIINMDLPPNPPPTALLNTTTRLAFITPFFQTCNPTTFSFSFVETVDMRKKLGNSFVWAHMRTPSLCYERALEEYLLTRLQ